MEFPRDCARDVIRYSAWPLALCFSTYVAATHSWTPFSVRLTTETVAVSEKNPDKTVNSAGPVLQQTSEAGIPTVEQGATDYLAKARRLEQQGQAETATNTTTETGSARAWINDPDKASAIAKAFFDIDGINDFSDGTDLRKIVYAFFDPRCPYCHKAIKDLSGKLPIKWIPIVVLGEQLEGEAIASGLLTGNRLENLKSFVASGQYAKGPDEQKQAHKDILDNNRNVYATILAGNPDLQRGVPLFFVPDKNNGFTILIGYDDNYDKQIFETYKK